MLEQLRFWPFSWAQKQETHPAFALNHGWFKDIDQNQPLEHYNFVVFDTELTGLSRKDEIVSIGAVHVRDLRIVAGETFHSFVRPHKITKATESTFLHRITPEQLALAPSLKEILPKFLEFCGPSLLVGHYVSLDVGFINQAAKKIFGSTISNPCLDTMRMAQIYTETCWEKHLEQFNLQISFNLADLSTDYGLPAFSQHDALQDSLQTAYLFIYLAKKLKDHGLITLKDLFDAGRSWKRVF
ncbi:MAG: 3'-5' exonuclease [Deltaproteobacteria bacterium]|nr:3'-5' exonuclease [Deltaproteobacteria bacterium]